MRLQARAENVLDSGNVSAVETTRAHMPKFSEKLFDKICKRIANGEAVVKICRDDDMPSQDAFYRWLRDDSTNLNERYARAREAQGDALFDECLAIADQYDEAEKTAEGGTDHIQRAKLRIDTRKWMAGKLRPKKYGDKVEVRGAGDKGEHLHRDVTELTDDDLAAIATGCSD